MERRDDDTGRRDTGRRDDDARHDDGRHDNGGGSALDADVERAAKSGIRHRGGGASSRGAATTARSQAAALRRFR